MKLSNYFPTFRYVLIQEMKERKTAGGLYVPSTVFTEDKEWLVIKTGKECTTVQPGDVIRVARGIKPDDLRLDEGNFNQVLEMQIVGYERDELSSNHFKDLVNDDIRVTSTS